MIEPDQLKNSAILIVDDLPLFRFGLRQVISQHFSTAVVHERTHQGEAMEVLQAHRIDFLIMSLKPGGKNGLQWIADVKKRLPGLSILITGCQGKCPGMQAFMEAGVGAFMHKSCRLEDLKEGLLALANGKTFFLFNTFATEMEGDDTKAPPAVTKREREILKLIFQEHTNPEIADILSISRRTVDTHRKNLLKKMNVRNTVGLVRTALRMGLVNLEI